MHCTESAHLPTSISVLLCPTNQGGATTEEQPKQQENAKKQKKQKTKEKQKQQREERAESGRRDLRLPGLTSPEENWALLSDSRDGEQA
jgi:hypothetical protein